jgi:hypothetical protein
MSEPASSVQEFGFDRDPFSTTIADEEIASQYDIVGRDEQEYQLQRFVEDCLREPDLMKRRLIFGEYGTGKSHHLIKLRDSIRRGVELEESEYEAVAVYLGNLGLSIRRLYENIISEIKESAPELKDYIESLPSVEPDSSVDEAYEFEKLRDNIVDNIRKIAQTARREHEYRCVYIFIDEAEDIANADEEKVQPFVRAFLHFVNELNASGVHMLLGFSQGARMRITSYDEEEDTLGNALMQRFQGGEIYLGDLTAEDVKEMLIDRMDHHRSTNRGSLTPVVEETVPVVKGVTGGHPREILRIYSQALEYAAEIGADHVDGDAIVYALTGFKSFVRDEELLSQRAITSLKKALDDVHPDARGDFERLQGRLIGENEAVDEQAFTNGVPDDLLRPVTITGEGESQEIRVLEQREQHGQYSYVLSEEAREFLFGGTEDKGTEIQKLDLRASNAPEKYQQHLSRGLGLALRAAGHGNLHKDTISTGVDRYEYHLYLIDVKRGDAKRDQTVAVGTYNGQEIPKELVSLYVKALDEGGASFGVLVKQNQKRSASANKYLNEIDPTLKNAFRTRVVDVDVTTEQRDEFIYGRLLALGDPDTDADRDINENEIIDGLGVITDLEELFEEELLPYPNRSHRDLIDHLEAEDEKDFTIGDLRDILDLQDFELNSDIMEGLRSQGLVAKEGRRWTYPDIENDKPPWYKIYSEINESGPLTIDEIHSRLASQYAFDCPDGDEHAMLQWFLNHLQRQNYVETNTVVRDGSKVEVYDVVSVEDQYNEALARANNRYAAAENLYDRAVELSVEGVNNYENKLEDLEKRLNEYDEIFSPDHNDLNGVQSLTEEIIKVEEDLESDINTFEEQIIGNAHNLRDHRIEDLLGQFAEADVGGSFSSRLNALRSDLEEYREELKTLIENEQHVQLIKRTEAIKKEVDAIEEDFEEITGLKQRCTKRYSEIQEQYNKAENLVKEISSENPKKSKFESELSTLEGHLDEYKTKYNDNEFQSALEILNEHAEPLADELVELANPVLADQRDYLRQVEDLLAQTEQIDDEERQAKARKVISEAREETKHGNFAEVPLLIEEAEELLEGPSRYQQFITKLRDVDGELGSLVAQTDFSEDEAFRFLQEAYASDVSEVRALFTGGDP